MCHHPDYPNMGIWVSKLAKKKFGNVTLVDYIFPLIKPIGTVFYLVFIVDLSPLQRGIAGKDRAFMEREALVNVWVAPQKDLPK